MGGEGCGGGVAVNLGHIAGLECGAWLMCGGGGFSIITNCWKHCFKFQPLTEIDS